jgi:NADPH:quinone reductase
MGELITRVADSTLSLPVEAMYALGEIRAACAANLAPGRVGKILLKP